MTSPVKIWRNQGKIAGLLGKRGKIVSWTIIRVPPAGFSSHAPYPVVLVKLSDGTCLTAAMVDYTEMDLQVGQQVITVLRRAMESNTDGIIPYGVKVKPILKGDA